MKSKGKIQLFWYIHSLLYKIMPSIVESKCNKPMLLFDTFRYTQGKVLSTTIYWKCENRSCPGHAIQYGSNPSSMKKLHNHDDDKTKRKVEEFRTKLKRRSEDSPQPVKRIYREHLISLYTMSPQITPMFHEIKNSLYKTRNTSYPPAPCTIDDANIEGIWSKTSNGEQFILHNSIHPIFGTLESLKQLSNRDNDRYFLMEHLNHAQIHSINYMQFIR